MITVDGQDIRGWKLDEVMPKLLGPAGSRSVCAHTRACAASTCETSSCSKNRLASSASNCNAVNAVRAQSHALAYAPRVSMLQRGPGVSAESQHGQCFHHKGARPKHQAVGVPKKSAGPLAPSKHAALVAYSACAVIQSGYLFFFKTRHGAVESEFGSVCESIAGHD